MMIPTKLKKGDEVRIIAPARSMAILGEDCKKLATERLEELGLKVTFGKHVMEADPDYFAASKEARVEDLNDAFRDKNVKAILTVIGGFNSNQMLDYIDYEAIKENPKKADCHNGSPLLFVISIFQMHSADCRKVFQMFHPKPFSSMIQKRPNP